MDNELNNTLVEQNKILSSIDEKMKTVVGTLKFIRLILLVSVVFIVLSLPF